MHTKYQAGIGKFQHLVCNSQPDIGNAVHKLSRQFVQPTKTNYNAMLSTLQNMKNTANQGLGLNPFWEWDVTRKG